LNASPSLSFYLQNSTKPNMKDWTSRE
jgi:hypothetical protein